MALEREKIEKIVLFAVIGCVGIAMVWMFYLKGRIKLIADGGAKIAELEEQLREAHNIIKRAGISKNALGDLRAKVEQFREDIPSVTMDTWIINKVNAICKELDVRYEHWRPGETEEFKDTFMAESFCRRKVDVAIGCDYHTLGMFVNKLENSSPFINVDGLVVRGTSDLDRQEVQFTIGYVASKK